MNVTTGTLPPVGEWLGRSFRALGRRFFALTGLAILGGMTAFLGAALVYLAAGAAVYFFADPQALQSVSAGGGIAALAQEPSFAMMIFGVHLLAGFVAMRMWCWFFLAMVHLTADPGMTFGSALGTARKRSFAFLGLLIAQNFLIQIGMFLLIIPGLILSVYLGFSAWAFARDGAGIGASMKESLSAVKGRWFGVFGRMLLLGLVCTAMMIVPIAGWIAAPLLALCACGELFSDLSPSRSMAAARTAPRTRTAPMTATPSTPRRTAAPTPSFRPEPGGAA